MPLVKKTVLDIGFAKKVPQDGLCYTCGKRGHGYYNCPNQKLDNVCDLCGKLGHLSVSCPSKPKGCSTDIVSTVTSCVSL